MKRERDFEEVLISSDSEEDEQEEGGEEDWKEEDADDDADAQDTSDDEDEEEDDEGSSDDDCKVDDDDYDEEDDDDDNDDDDGSLSDFEDEDEEDGSDDHDDDVFGDVSDSHSSSSEQNGSNKATKRVTSGHYGTLSVQRSKKRKMTTQRQKLTKPSRHARGKTVLSEEDQKLFSEALNIIREGDVDKLKLEHCKAYLRRYSLRLAGSISVLHDRVQEHVELKAHGGMAKYPRSAFTVDCTGDACTGDIVLFKQKVKSYNKPGTNVRLPRLVTQIVVGRIVKESYGSDKQQHTFTVEVLWSRGPKQLPLLYPLLIKGRNLYRYRTFRQRWRNEEERKKVLKEKHSRGDVARNAREVRVSGKSYSCLSRRTQIRNSTARLSLRKEREGESSQSASKSSVKVQSSVTHEDTTLKEKTVFRVARSLVKDHDNGSHNGDKPTVSKLTIKACFVGRLIGTRGRHIDSIVRASGAQLHVCAHPSSAHLRMVEIVGTCDQVQVATQMVVQSFLNRGLPPPAEAT